MRGVNKVILVGTLGRDPETKTFPNGGSLTQFSIATSESWTDKSTGERKEQTEWHQQGEQGFAGGNDFNQPRFNNNNSNQGGGYQNTGYNNNNQNGYGQQGGNYAGSPQAGNGFNTPKSSPQPAAAPADLDDDLPF